VGEAMREKTIGRATRRIPGEGLNSHFRMENLASCVTDLTTLLQRLESARLTSQLQWRAAVRFANLLLVSRAHRMATEP
jgi:hypothetical protein